MTLQAIQPYNIVILSFSVIILTLFTVFKLFKLSGFIINLIAHIVYIISIIAKNIYFQFLGLSILFVFFLIALYFIFVFVIYNKKKIVFNSFHHGAIYPFEETPITINAEHLPISFPGIFYLVSFNVYENGDMIDSQMTPITGMPDNNVNLSINFKRHGFFTLKDFYFIFSDIFGLTKYKLGIDTEYKVRVFPFFSESVKIPFFLDKGGEEILQSVVKIDSTDFFENRKYYPGDDTRRINWKIFAHSGELHIREVEKIPPKIGEISILFAPYSPNINEYEYISSLFLATVYYLISYEFQLKIYSPASLRGITIDKSKEKDFNHIIDFSYREFNNDFNKRLDNLIIFSSFYEYKRLLERQKIKKSYSAVSYFKSDNEIKDILKTLFIAKNHDNFFTEYYSIAKEMKHDKNMDKDLEEIANISNSKKIEMCLYRV